MKFSCSWDEFLSCVPLVDCRKNTKKYVSVRSVSQLLVRFWRRGSDPREPEADDAEQLHDLHPDEGAFGAMEDAFTEQDPKACSGNLEEWNLVARPSQVLLPVEDEAQAAQHLSCTTSMLCNAVCPHNAGFLLWSPLKP